MLDINNLVFGRKSLRISANMQIPEGSRLGLIGPSGSGKSTFLDSIVGLLAPHSGQVSWRGTNITALPPHKRPFTLLSQSGNLFSHLPIWRSLLLTIAPNRRASEADKARVEDALTALGLQGLGGRYPAELSGGQLVRAGLARALLEAKPILLLDEPFTGLGPALGTEMRELVREHITQRSQVMILISHDMKDIRALCDMAMVLHGNRLSSPIAASELLAHPPDHLSDYLGSGQRK